MTDKSSPMFADADEIEPASLAPMCEPLHPVAAHKDLIRAVMIDGSADHAQACGMSLEAAVSRSTADRLRTRADTSLTLRCPPEIGPGAEAVPERTAENRDIMDTMESPSRATLVASHDRLALAVETGAGALALDLAETIRAKNSAEKMMAHQLAACHRMVMRFAADMDDHLDGRRNCRSVQDQQLRQIEAARCANAMARLMGAFQAGFETLASVRRGGKQTVVVQRVEVKDGGQAIVAGKMKTGGGRGRKTKRGAGRK